VAGRTTLPITDNELASAVTAAREAMMQVILLQHDYEAVFQEAIDIPAEAGEEALRTLAEAGADLFQKLFLHPAGGADAKAVGRWLRDYATDPTLRLTFQVVAHEAPIPWALLYLGDASEDAELDWNNFLGMRHIVEQLPLQTSLSTRNYEIPSKPSLAVSLNVNTSIDADLGITLVEEHQQYWADTAVGLDDLDLVTRSTRREVVAALKNPQTSDRIVYFYCHATAGDPAHANPDEAAIIMSQGDVLRLDYLNRNASTEIQLAGNPLVFINACESAELSPLFYNGFVPYFMAKGARGVIGTECKTPALFAIEWANEFFKRFLDGKAVGETVLQLRQDFLREHNNPLGLIYAIHCDADTRITPALARSS
jgi:CHAT domain